MRAAPPTIDALMALLRRGQADVLAGYVSLEGQDDPESVKDRAILDQAGQVLYRNDIEARIASPTLDRAAAYEALATLVLDVSWLLDGGSGRRPS